MEHREQTSTPLATRVIIQTVAWTVGLVIFVLFDHFTGWVGVFN